MRLAIIVALVLTLFPMQAHATERTLTLEQIQWLHRWFPGRELAMARTTWCESNFRDDVVGANDERGRLQILPLHAWINGFTPSDLSDPEVNGYIGSIILKQRPDGSAWSMWKGCSEWPM